MSSILSFASIALTVFGMVYSGIYIWLQLAPSTETTDKRAAALVGSIRWAMILSLIFAFLSFLLGNANPSYAIVSRLGKLYSTLTILWIVVLIVCGLAMSYLFLAKNRFRPGSVRSIHAIFKVALWGALAAGVLSWLFG